MKSVLLDIRPVNGETFTLRERIVAAKELSAGLQGSVSIGVGFLESLADDLLHCPLEQLAEIRDELVPIFTSPSQEPSA